MKAWFDSNIQGGKGQPCKLVILRCYAVQVPHKRDVYEDQLMEKHTFFHDLTRLKSLVAAYCFTHFSVKCKIVDLHQKVSSPIFSSFLPNIYVRCNFGIATIQICIRQAFG